MPADCNHSLTRLAPEGHILDQGDKLLHQEDQRRRLVQNDVQPQCGKDHQPKIQRDGIGNGTLSGPAPSPVYTLNPKIG